MPGSLVLGKYEILRPLAEGGAGAIFLARQSGIPGFERLAILKKLRPDVLIRPGAVEAFLDEARVVALLNHPNIVSLYEVGIWEGTHYIALEYIHGITLSSLIRLHIQKDKKIPAYIIAHIIRDAALALDHAHYAQDLRGQFLGIVHRDISPQNIMIRSDGCVKILDFGIAKGRNRTTSTQAGLIKGKAGYMAPEQILGLELDGRADQFALGCVMWELMALQRLFYHENETEAFKMILKELPVSMTEVLEYPDSLLHICTTMLEKDKNKRFMRCRDVSDSLGAYLSSQGMLHTDDLMFAFAEEWCLQKVDTNQDISSDERKKAEATTPATIITSVTKPVDHQFDI